MESKSLLAEACHLRIGSRGVPVVGEGGRASPGRAPFTRSGSRLKGLRVADGARRRSRWSVWRRRRGKPTVRLSRSGSIARGSSTAGRPCVLLSTRTSSARSSVRTLAQATQLVSDTGDHRHQAYRRLGVRHLDEPGQRSIVRVTCVVARASRALLPARRGTGAQALRCARATSRGPPRRDAEPLWRVRPRRGPER